MGHVRLTAAAVAKRSIQRRPWRSFCLIFAVLLFSFALFAGSVLTLSLSSGAESMANRLGADVMIVPAGYDPHIDSILLSGKPSNFYLPADTLERLSRFEGIERMSPQTFLATLSASCCSYPVQLMGIDFDSDFLVKPWLDATLRRELRDGELIVGYRVTGEPGDKIKFFGKELTVVGRLEQTGMGFDAAVFLNRPTIAMLAKEAERIIKHPLAADGSLISTVMIKLKPGEDSVQTAREMNSALNGDGIYALFSKKFVNSISASLKTVSWMVRGGLLFLWLLALALIALLFAMSLAERRREMGVLRALGASRSKLIRMALTEAFLVSLYGASLGVALGAAAVAAGSPFVTEALRMPFLLPAWPTLIFLALGAAAASLLTGLSAALFSAVRAAKSAISDAMREA